MPLHVSLLVILRFRFITCCVPLGPAEYPSNQCHQHVSSMWQGRLLGKRLTGTAVGVFREIRVGEYFGGKSYVTTSICESHNE